MLILSGQDLALADASILNILRIATAADQNAVVVNALYVILKELSTLQHNLATLDKVLDFAAHPDDMR